ncbi:uncharacterized protein A4U43_UnF5650 [Asparagus officinalis]|uniref:Uncharacterized protein n=1 Tax=Asparagus officinalis TaxID=4686 RepID=A0A1R3L6M2_ASPOF|nr:uncharacterized protein A4U43_UnF5650 [Asparagus officinalis]
MAPKLKPLTSKGEGKTSSLATPTIATAAIGVTQARLAAFSNEALLRGRSIRLASGTSFVAPHRFLLLDPVPVFDVNKASKLKQAVSEGYYLTMRELSTNATLVDS